MNKLIRLSTVPLSLNTLLKGQLNFLNDYFDVIAVSGNGPDLNVVAEREGVFVSSIEMERQISPIKDFISLIKLYFYFRNERPFIVHSITPKAGLLSMIAAKFAGVPIRMHTFTGLIFPSKTGVLQKILIAMDKLLCLCATNIYPEGEGVKKDLMLYNITKKELNVIGNGNINGINKHHFNPELYTSEDRKSERQKLGIRNNDFVFIFVGRLVGDKGINELVKAFKNLSNENDSVKLILVGPIEADLDPLQEETLQEIKANESIIYVGFQEDVRVYFAVSDCLVFPSYREGFPNVVMQAGAMGLPSIVTDINGSNEIIIDGKNGIIIPVKSWIAILEAMKKIFNEHDFRNLLKNCARDMIVSRYEQEVVWEALLLEYKKLEANLS